MAVVAGILIVVGSSIIRAAPFDEIPRAPTSWSRAELNEKTRSYVQSFREETTTMLKALQDPDEHEKWLDLWWHIGQAIDARQPLNGFQEFGFIPQGDGSYRIDLEHFPQWNPLDRKMQYYLSPDVRDKTFESLVERGFRDHDISTLRRYLNDNNLEALTLVETATLTSSFGKKVEARAALGQQFSKDDALSYEYQISQTTAEASRAWALGVMAILDQQRQRILESYLLEVPSIMGVFPSTADENATRLREYFLSGSYAKDVAAQVQRANQLSQDSEMPR